MSAHGAYRLFKMNKNLNSIFGIELLCAAQGVESRQPLKTSPLLQNAVDELRKHVPRLNEDRFVSNDIKIKSQNDIIIDAVKDVDIDTESGKIYLN